ncbi:MAG: hypothetical protein R3C05_18445 [Pirellulaceae bacterium]
MNAFNVMLRQRFSVDLATWSLWGISAIILMADSAQAKGTSPVAESVFEWRFDQSNDLNYDNWPDNWRRRQGKQYPAYLSIEIVPKNAELMEAAIRADHQFKPYRRWAEKIGLPAELQFSETLVDRYLRVQLNGGAAIVQSPPIDVDDVYSYRFSGAIQTRGLKHDTAWIEFLFLDGNGDVLVAYPTDKYTGDQPWTQLSLDPIAPPPKARKIVARLHLEPQDNQDIYGEAGFDNIRIECLPKVQLQTNNPRGLYATRDDVSATCRISGLAQRITSLRFRLVDPHGKLLAEHSSNDGNANEGLAESAFQTMTQRWDLPKLSPGFYRLHADLYAQETRTHTATTSFAVVEHYPAAESPFGWTLGTGHDPITRRELPQWLHQCGVGWVKYPCWLAPDDLQGADDLAWLLERLQEQNIRGVGMLDQPPSKPRRHAQLLNREPLAPLLRDPQDWRPQLEALMTRLSMRTTWWQIGGEGDFSFLRHPNLPEAVDEIRRELQGFGQPIRVALSWPWLEPTPSQTIGGWKAVCLTEDQAFTAAELDANLKALPSDGLQKWITLDPLDATRYSLEDRIGDLVGRMLTARKRKVPVAFVSNPFDARIAMLSADGLPDEMLLPWRTTATLIGSLDHAGSIHMPGDSRNVVMTGEHRAVMVLWSDRPRTEKLYLGEDVQQVDVWGHRQPVPTDPQGRQIVRVDRLPVFLTNVNPLIAKFRIAAKLQPARLESLPGRQQVLNLSLKNTFGAPVSGRFTMQSPATWEIARQSRDINISETATTEIPIEISLRSNAVIGRHRVRFDFAIEADKRSKFSVWRNIDVGPDDLKFEPSFRFDASGALIVTVTLSNHAQHAQDYNCYLMTQSQSRQHQRMQMTVGPVQQVSKDFVWPNGKDLIGTTMTLQAEDRNGKRVLIYPIDIHD